MNVNNQQLLLMLLELFLSITSNIEDYRIEKDLESILLAINESLPYSQVKQEVFSTINLWFYDNNNS